MILQSMTIYISVHQQLPAVKMNIVLFKGCQKAKKLYEESLCRCAKSVMLPTLTSLDLFDRNEVAETDCHHYNDHQMISAVPVSKCMVEAQERVMVRLH